MGSVNKQLRCLFNKDKNIFLDVLSRFYTSGGNGLWDFIHIRNMSIASWKQYPFWFKGLVGIHLHPCLSKLFCVSERKLTSHPVQPLAAILYPSPESYCNLIAMLSDFLFSVLQRFFKLFLCFSLPWNSIMVLTTYFIMQTAIDPYAADGSQNRMQAVLNSMQEKC